MRAGRVLAAIAVAAGMAMLAKGDPGRSHPSPAEAARKAVAGLEQQLSRQGLAAGAPIFLRIFKQESELELWLRDAHGFRLFKTYPICKWSGKLGPKLKEGDGQSPEGFYFVGAEALNPKSRFHLSFNLGFPNAYDRARGRTGSYLMVHGDCASIGCYAMTDPAIEEIYGLAEAALEAGQPFFRVHIFPFRMTRTAMDETRGSEWSDFWANLKEGYDLFENSRLPPDTSLHEGRYSFRAG